MSTSLDLSTLETLTGWDQLQQNEQEKVKNETIAAQEDRKSERESRLSLGKRLLTIRTILEPVGAWVEWLKNVFHMSVATAYRYIENYEIVSKKVSKKLLTMALNLGFELPARKLETARPPKTDDPEENLRFLERINNSSKGKVIVVEHPPDEVLKLLLNEFVLGFKRLPKIPRTRASSFERLVGMMMTQIGITAPRTFEPCAVPEKYIVKRGRPPLKKVPTKNAA